MGQALKNEVARQVAELLDRNSWASASMPENVRDVEVSHPTSLQTQLRVKTENEGTHYFLVKVSEMM